MIPKKVYWVVAFIVILLVTDVIISQINEKKNMGSSILSSEPKNSKVINIM
jgi:hypothetical protein